MKKLSTIIISTALVFAFSITITSESKAAASLKLINSNPISTGQLAIVRIINEPLNSYSITINPDVNNVIQTHKNLNTYIYFIAKTAGTKTIELKDKNTTLAQLNVEITESAELHGIESGTALELNNATASSTVHFTLEGAATQGVIWGISDVTTPKAKTKTAYHFFDSDNSSITWIEENKNTNDFNIYLNSSKITTNSILNINGTITNGALYWSGIDNGLLNIYKATNSNDASTFLPSASFHRSNIATSQSGSNTYITWIEDNKLRACLYNGEGLCASSNSQVYEFLSNNGDKPQSTTISENYLSALVQTAENTSRVVMCELKSSNDFINASAGTVCKHGYSERTLSSGIARNIKSESEYLTWEKDAPNAPFEIYMTSYEMMFETANQPVALTSKSTTDNKNPFIKKSCRDNMLYITYESNKYGKADESNKYGKANIVLKQISPLNANAKLLGDETEFIEFGNTKAQTNPHILHTGETNQKNPHYKCKTPNITINYIETGNTNTQIKQASIKKDNSKKLYISKVFSISNNTAGTKFNKLTVIPAGVINKTTDITLEYAFPGEDWTVANLTTTAIKQDSYLSANILNPFRQEYIQLRMNINNEDTTLAKFILLQNEEQTITEEFEGTIEEEPVPTDRLVDIQFKLDNITNTNYTFSYNGPESGSNIKSDLLEYLDYGSYTFTITNLNNNNLLKGSSYTTFPNQNNKFKLEVPAGEETISFIILTQTPVLQTPITTEEEKTLEEKTTEDQLTNTTEEIAGEDIEKDEVEEDNNPDKTGKVDVNIETTNTELEDDYVPEFIEGSLSLADIESEEELTLSEITEGGKVQLKKFFRKTPAKVTPRRKSISIDEKILNLQINNIQPQSTLNDLDLIIGVAPNKNQLIHLFVFSESGLFTKLGSTKVEQNNTFEFIVNKLVPIRGEVLLAASETENINAIIAGTTNADIIPIKLTELHEGISIIPALSMNIIESSLALSSNGMLLPKRQKEMLTLYRTNEQDELNITLAGNVIGENINGLRVEGFLKSDMKTHLAQINPQKKDHFTLNIKTPEVKNGTQEVIINAYNQDLHKSKTIIIPLRIEDLALRETIIGNIWKPIQDRLVQISFLLLLATILSGIIIIKRRQRLRYMYPAWSWAIIIILILEIATSGWTYGSALAHSLHKVDIINLPNDTATHTYTYLGNTKSIFSLNNEDRRLSEFIFDRLVRIDENLNLTPELAVSWSIINDSTWQINLRKNVKFHNQEQFTEKDVINTLKFINKKKMPIASLFGNIAKISNPKKSTIIIETKKPDPYLLNKLAYLPILNSNDLSQWEENSKPNGTGPFKLIYSSATESIFEKTDFAQYHKNRNLPLQYLKLQSIPNIHLKLEEAKKQKTSTINELTPEIANKIQNLGYKSKEITSTEAVFLMFNTQNEGIKSLTARTQVFNSVDREKIAEKYKLPAKPTYQFTNPGILGFNGALEKQLSENKKNKSIPTSFMELHYPQSLKLIAAEVSTQLKAKGMSTKPVEHLDSTYFKDLKEGVNGMYLIKWAFGLGDSIDFLEFMIASESEFNNNYYSNSLADSLITKASSEFNRLKKADLLREIMEEITLKNPAGVPLISVRNISASKIPTENFKNTVLKTIAQ